MRILLRRIHLIVSLIAGGWLAISGLSGALLVWGDALERRVHPELFRVARPGERAPLERVLENASRAGAAPVVRIRLAGSATPVHEVWTGCDRCVRVWIDPSTAGVNGARGADQTIRGFLHELHRRMLSGGRGETLVGIGGIALSLLALSGIVLWWPRGAWRRALAVRAARGWKLLNHDLHRTGGFLLAPFLLVSSLTGIYFVFHGPFDRLAARIDGPATSSAVAGPLPAEGIGLDRSVARAAALFPGSEPTWLTPSGASSPDVVVRLRQASEHHPNGRTFVAIDAATGRVRTATDAMAAGPARRILDILYPLHIGHLGGVGHRVALTLAGLAPSILFASGLLMWWNRSLRRRVAGHRADLELIAAAEPLRARERRRSSSQ